MKLRNEWSDETNETHFNFEITQRSSNDMTNIPVYEKIVKNVTFDSACQWIAPLYAFAKMLSDLYGYDVVESIQIEGVSLSEAVYNMNNIVSVTIGSLDDWAGEDAE